MKQGLLLGFINLISHIFKYNLILQHSMRRAFVIIGIILLAFFLISCSSEQAEQTIVKVTSDATLQEQPQEQIQDTQEVNEETPKTTVKITQTPKEESKPQSQEVKTQETSEIDKLINKGKATTNYQYYFISTARDENGHYYEKASYDTYIKEDKIKKVYISPKKLDEESYYNEVYLDTAEESAIGICTKIGVLCKGIYDKAYQIDYETEKLAVTSVGLLENVGSDAQKVSEEVINNRKTTVIEYTNSQGQKERLALDRYYGLPLKQLIYVTEGDEETISEKSTFSKVSTGNVKNADVTLPAEYLVD